MKCIIEEADNGYILTVDYEDSDPDIKPARILIEEKSNEKETFSSLVIELTEHLGRDIQYDKYSKENLNITWDKPGHKLE